MDPVSAWPRPGTNDRTAHRLQVRPQRVVNDRFGISVACDAASRGLRSRDRATCSDNSFIIPYSLSLFKLETGSLTPDVQLEEMIAQALRFGSRVGPRAFMPRFHTG
jgi:hypothetical protein